MAKSNATVFTNAAFGQVKVVWDNETGEGEVKRTNLTLKEGAQWEELTHWAPEFFDK